MYRHQHHHGPSIFNLGGGGTTFNRHNIVKFKPRDPFKSSAIIDPFASNNSTVVNPFANVNNPTNSVNQPTNTPTPHADPYVFPMDPVVSATRNKKLPALPPKEEDVKFDDVFDFPDTLQTEVKLMIASSTRQIITKSGKKQPKRIVPKKTTSSETKSVKPTTALKKKNSQSSLTSKAATTNNTPAPVNSKPATLKDIPMYIPPPLPQQSNEQDIFAFDSNPELKVTHRSIRNHTTNAYNTTNNSTAVLSFTTSKPYNTQPTSIASMLNPLPPQQSSVKRKRNLVAHLKSASGEEIKTCSNLDFLSSDEESELLPIHEIIQKERSVSPELSYAQRMELELESLLKPDTLLSQEEVPAKKRIAYQPQNKVPVRFTFAKKK